ncbi:Carboxypeptidase N subunit 2-like protein [Dinothrombium tinctorium]|uniref:Carboxypeptidase N subunit 2-like protein n=1 Tax=Dinothrombium tinctorium TaxID=1965070 RepID=A0A443RHD9_9ACAR|nr:Carboxypeptidase N subunit 2-like protein [Dinothrombium tinctorium]
MKLWCDKGKFIEIPAVSELPNNTYELDLSLNELTSVNFSEPMESLSSLDLTGNEIQEIKSKAFDNVPTLEFLDLTDNQIEEIEVDAFAKLKNLKYLNLTNNKLGSLQKDTFNSLIWLRELRLAKNPLTHIHPDLLLPLKNLMLLDLTEISAYTLKDDQFHFTPNLETLFLSSNKFRVVPVNGLRSAAKLKSLYLDENPFAELIGESFVGLSTLNELSVSKCSRLTDIKRETFSDLYNLKRLTIKSNPALTYIDQHAFRRMFNSSWLKLEEVDLSNNRLMSLAADALPWCELKKLDLTENHWTCDCKFKWIKSCQNENVVVRGVRCAQPEQHRTYEVSLIDVDRFSCPRVSEVKEMRVFRMMIFIIGSAMLLVLSVMLALLIKREGIVRWWRERRRGNGAIYYVKARSTPADCNDM